MIRRSMVGTLLALVATGGLLVPACFLPDYTVEAGDGVGVDGAVPGEGGTPPVDGATSDGPAPESGLVCAAGTGDCDGVASNGCEVDLRTSNQSCGACKRSCGNVQCQAGECQTERVVSGLAEPMGLELAGARLLWYANAAIFGCRADDCATSRAIMADVDGSMLPTGTNTPRQIAVVGQNFYFSQCPPGSNSDCGVAECDVGGCKATGAKYVVASNTNRRATLLVAGGGGVYTHQGIDGLYRTDLTTRTVEYQGGKYAIQDQLQAFHLDAQQALVLDDNASQANPTGGLFRCPASGCAGAGSRVRLLPPPVRHLSFDKGVAYTSAGSATTSAGSIVSCDVKGCGGAGTVLATNQPYISDIVADGPAVYWSTVGAANPATNTAAVGAVMRCLLPACAGGPTKIAEGLLNPTSVRVDATYVYWLERGVTGQSNGTISRRRR